jgi:DNA-binding Lrp family transcriptional regulator
MVKLDIKDKKILYELDTNSRQSIPQLSKKVGLHKNALRYRMRRFERQGVITNYYTVIDSYKLGYMVLKFYTAYQNATSSIKKEIVDYLVKSKITWLVSSVEGEFDLDVIFWIKNMNQFYSYWNKTLNKYGKYFRDQVLYYQIQAISYRPSYLLFEKRKPDNEKFEITGYESTIHIDDLDYRLLYLLSSDARLSIVNIAKKLGITTNIARYRIKKLLKLDIIQGFRINIDISKLGYQNVKVDLFLNDYNEKTKIIEYLKHNPYLLCIMTSIGRAHIELEFNVENTKNLYHILEDLIDKFPNIINYYKYFTFLENHKLSWIPEL